MTPKGTTSRDLQEELEVLESQQRDLLTSIAISPDDSAKERLKALQVEGARLKREIEQRHREEERDKQQAEASRKQEREARIEELLLERDAAARGVELAVEGLREVLVQFRETSERAWAELGHQEPERIERLFRYPGPEVYRLLAGRLFPHAPVVSKAPLQELVDELPRT